MGAEVQSNSRAAGLLGLQLPSSLAITSEMLGKGIQSEGGCITKRRGNCGLEFFSHPDSHLIPPPYQVVSPKQPTSLGGCEDGMVRREDREHEKSTIIDVCP